jgi:acetyltransferase-like isoleucine patch superfamily enzyme
MIYFTPSGRPSSFLVRAYVAVRHFLQKIDGKIYRILAGPAFGRLDSGVRPEVKVGNPQCLFVGPRVGIHEYTWIYAIIDDRDRKNAFSPRIEIQEGCNIGRFCQITCSNRLVFEKNVFLSEGILVTDSVHGYQDLEAPVIGQELISLGPVIIGEGSWLGSGARLVGRVTLGRNVVVAANAVVVNKVVPPFCMVAGVPARIIKIYDEATKRWVPTDRELASSL